jgi:hypothetical protein
MSNHIGDTMNIIASPVQLTQEVYGAHHIVIRAAINNNGAVYFGKDSSGWATGYLLAGDSAPFYHIAPQDIWVWGTAGDDIVWHGDKA